MKHVKPNYKKPDYNTYKDEILQDYHKKYNNNENQTRDYKSNQYGNVTPYSNKSKFKV